MTKISGILLMVKEIMMETQHGPCALFPLDFRGLFWVSWELGRQDGLISAQDEQC